MPGEIIRADSLDYHKEMMIALGFQRSLKRLFHIISRK